MLLYMVVFENMLFQASSQQPHFGILVEWYHAFLIRKSTQIETGGSHPGGCLFLSVELVAAIVVRRGFF